MPGHPDRGRARGRALRARRAQHRAAQRDNQRLIETLVRLKELGNTLIVVEHDEDTIKHRRLGRRHRSRGG